MIRVRHGRLAGEGGRVPADRQPHDAVRPPGLLTTATATATADGGQRLDVRQVLLADQDVAGLHQVPGRGGSIVLGAGRPHRGFTEVGADTFDLFPESLLRIMQGTRHGWPFLGREHGSIDVMEKMSV